jgi:hypothetical protein
MPLIDPNVTRLPRGLTNVEASDIFNSLRQFDPNVYQQFFDDFHVFASASYSTGGVGTPTRAAQAGAGGLFRLGNSAADNDNSWIQQANPTFLLTAGKKTFFSARVTPSDATQSDFVVGLQIAVASNNFLTPVNGLFVRKADDAATMVLVNRAASTETVSTGTATAVDATSSLIQMFYDGIDSVWAAHNGTIFGKVTPAALPSVLMGWTIGVQNGTAVAKTLDVDQVFVAQER